MGRPTRSLEQRLAERTTEKVLATLSASDAALRLVNAERTVAQLARMCAAQSEQLHRYQKTIRALRMQVYRERAKNAGNKT
jgi:uncharacterized coiled-coil protein SlyX